MGEEALKAMLRFREARKDRDQDIPFKKMKLANTEEHNAKPNWCSGEIPKKAGTAPSTPKNGAKKAAFGCGAPHRSSSEPPRSNNKRFDDWEADMLSRLGSFAAKQKAS